MGSPFDITLNPGYSQSGTPWPYVSEAAERTNQEGATLRNLSGALFGTRNVIQRTFGGGIDAVPSGTTILAMDEPTDFDRFDFYMKPGYFTSQPKPSGQFPTDRERFAAMRNDITQRKVKEALGSSYAPSTVPPISGGRTGSSVLGRRSVNRPPI